MKIGLFHFTCKTSNILIQLITNIASRRYDEAIKRFLFKRRLESRRRHLFLKYLQYGGVNTNQKYGQGVSLQELKDMSKEEAMEARNFTMVSPEWATGENIAFDKVLKGYL
jgi:hypothetical protein